MTEILGFLSSVSQLVSFINQAIALYRQAKQQGWLEDGRALAQKIQGAKSDDERRALVKALCEHASGL